MNSTDSVSRRTTIDPATGWVEIHEREAGEGGWMLVQSFQVPEIVRVYAAARDLAEHVEDEMDGKVDVEDGAEGPRPNRAMRLVDLARNVLSAISPSRAAEESGEGG